MIGQYIIWFIGAVMLGSWLMAFSSGIQLFTRGRRPEHRLFYLLGNGWLWFKQDTFLPEVAHIHRRFLISAGVFAIGLLFLMITSLVMSYN